MVSWLWERGMLLQMDDGDLAPKLGYWGVPSWVFMPTPTGNGDSFLEPSHRPPWPPVLSIQTPELFRGGPGPEHSLQVAVGGFLLCEALCFLVSLERLVYFLWSSFTSPPVATILSFRLDELPLGALILVLLPPAS